MPEYKMVTIFQTIEYVIAVVFHRNDGFTSVEEAVGIDHVKQR